MFVTSTRRRTLFEVAFGLIGSVIVVWLIHTSVTGSHGLMALQTVRAELKREESVLAQKQAERDKLKRRIELLRSSDGIDPDILEERARSMQNMGYENEIVLFATDKRPAPPPALPAGKR